MKALIIIEVDKFPIPNSNGGAWMPLNNTENGKYWVKLEAEKDLILNDIMYTIGNVVIDNPNI
tara:strand:+ start:474 stop:662 length:189 start_codon:yes stop_codon:yes gene_type:complete